MSEAEQNQSFVDPEVLERMTPEGQELLHRVLESTDLVITVRDASRQDTDTEDNPEDSKEERDMESIKSLPPHEQIAWLMQNFTRRTLLMAGREASRKPQLSEIIGKEAAQELQEKQMKRVEIQKRTRRRQSFYSAVKPRW